MEKTNTERITELEKRVRVLEGKNIIKPERIAEKSKDVEVGEQV